jgi:S1-C subfamily serine protease
MRRWILPFALFAIPLLGQDSVPAEQGALDLEKRWIRLAREAIARTVLVEVRDGGLTAGAGSGAVVSADGLVLTCAHVTEALGFRRLAASKYAVVTSDGRRRDAKLLGRSSRNDIALLKIEAEGLPHFEVSSDLKPASGDRVLAIGFPMGNLGTGGVRAGKSRDALVTPSVMVGRVEEPERAFVIPAQGGQKFYPRAIVSDTPVYMGNSGGPLVDESGRLLGLNAAIMPAANRTFSLSIRTVAKVFATLKEGKDARGEPMAGGLEETGRTILEALGSNFTSKKGDREWLRPPFEKLAKELSAGVVELQRNGKAVGFAVLLDDRGNAVTSVAALENRTWGEMLVREIDKQAGKNETLRDLWGRMKEMLERGEGADRLVARLSTGERVDVETVRDSRKYGVALLRLSLPESTKLHPIAQARYASLRAGQWGVTVGAGGRVLGAGLISSGRHSAVGVISLPSSLADLWEMLLRDGGAGRQETFHDAILHDSALGVGELGTPLVDSRGRLLGVNVYHPARGTTYAARLDNILGAFGLDSGF